jgi:hypothetical protein
MEDKFKIEKHFELSIKILVKMLSESDTHIPLKKEKTD